MERIMSRLPLAALLFFGLALPVLAAEKEHLRIKIDGPLPPAQAEQIYNQVKRDMAIGYAPARDPVVKAYPRWRRYNIASYLSDTHGNRYANNFANAKAAKAGYGKLEAGQVMPPGAIVVKDTFTVTKQGEVFPAAVFYMEKLAPGRSPATGDWRFVQLLPDGSYIGDTTGDSPEDVAFCFTCHKTMAKADFLFFLPKAYRK
jgi:hypothetical protein